MAEIKINEEATGIVTGIEKYGIFVSLENGYTGLIHISEISNTYVSNINKYAKIGEQISFVVLSINEKDKKMSLSLKRKDNNFKESGSGFLPLKENLSKWIKEKV